MVARLRSAWQEGYSIHAILMILRDEFPDATKLLQEPMLRTKMGDFGIFKELPNRDRKVRNRSYRSPKIRQYLALFKDGIGPVAQTPAPATVVALVQPERRPRRKHKTREAKAELKPDLKPKPRTTPKPEPKPKPAAQKIVVPPKKPKPKRGPLNADWDWFELLSPETRRRAEVVRDYQRAGGTELLTYDEITAILAERDKKAA